MILAIDPGNEQSGDDLFGATRPDLPPADFGGSIRAARNHRRQLSAEEKSERGKKHKQRKAQEALLHKKTRELYLAQGYFEFRCDRVIRTVTGRTFVRDLLGIGDRLAIGNKRVVLVQITTKSDVGRHIQKLSNPKNVVDFEDRKGVPVRVLAEEWLAFGGEIEIVGWEKVGARWKAEVQLVTVEMLVEAVGRRRSEGVI